MSLPNISFQITDGGTGAVERVPTGVALLVAGCTAGYGVATGETLGPYLSLKEAEAAGFSAAQDASDLVLIHRHIEDFFGCAPAGELYVFLVPQGTSLTDMVDPDENFAAKALRDAGGRVRIVMAVLNPSDAYTPTITTEMDADVWTALPKAYALRVAKWAEGAPVIVLLEGRSFTGDANAALSLRGSAYPGVGVVIAQDMTVAASDVELADYAAVGLVGGVNASNEPHRSIGHVGVCRVDDPATGRMAFPGIASQPIQDYLPEQLGKLHDKGYIFVRQFAGYTGHFINGGPCATAATSDLAYLERVRVLDEVLRVAREALMPYINAPIDIDPSTGFMSPAVAASIEGVVENKVLKACGQWIAGGTTGLRGFEAYVNPEQDVLGTKTLSVVLRIVPYGTSEQIEVQIGFTAKLS